MSETKMTEYVSQRSFSLNFDDKSPSALIRSGDVLAYDGMNVVFPRMGNDVKGRTVHLSRAISLGWLLLKETASSSQAAMATVTKEIPDWSPAKTHGETADNTTPQKGATYDSFRGGDFDSFMSPKTANFDNQLVPDDSRIAKRTGKIVSSGTPAAKKQVVVNDSVALKPSNEESAGQTRSGTKIIRSTDEDRIIPLKGVKQQQSATSQKKNAFLVDDTTPSLPDQASKEEVERALTKHTIEPQEARVFKKMGKIVVDEIDGVTLKTSVGSGDRPVDAPVKVGRGSTEVADLSGVNTDEQAEAAGVRIVAKIKPIETEEAELTRLASPQASPQENAAISPEKSKEFLSRLPETWAKMHWAQKEKFINSLTDMVFIRYIISVEEIKTVQRIGKARLQALKVAQESKE